MAGTTLLCLISILEYFLLYWLLCGTVLEKQYFRKKEWCIVWISILVMGIASGINRGLIFFSQSLFLMNIVIACICVIWINGQDKRLETIIIILYHIVVALLDFFFSFVCIIFLQQDFRNTVYIYANSLLECILFFCSRIVVVGCIFMIVKRKYEKAYIYEFQGVLLIITVIMCLMLRCYHIAIVRMMCESREREAGLVGISLVGILLVIFSIGVLYLKTRMLEREKDFLIMRDEMVAQRFVELESMVEKNRQLSHDLKNHLIALKNYEKEKDYGGIRHYIEEIEQEYFEVKVQTWTGNPVADMFLEQKKAMAEQEGIRFTIQAVPIVEWPFQDSETCSLLGNLLDNAIDACKRMDKSEDRWIMVKIESQKQLLFIKIINSVSEAPSFKHGRPVSAKRDKKIHGYGLKSVERIINKYEGVITYQVQENIFQVTLSF